MLPRQEVLFLISLSSVSDDRVYNDIEIYDNIFVIIQYKGKILMCNYKHKFDNITVKVY